MAVQALGVLQGQQCRLWWRLHCGPLAHSQVHGLGLRAWCVWLEGRAASQPALLFPAIPKAAEGKRGLLGRGLP